MKNDKKSKMCKKLWFIKNKTWNFELFFQQGVEIEPRKNQRRVRDEEKRKEKEKSNLKRQKSTWFCRRWAAPAEVGAGRWCLGPWSQRLVGEGTGGGWDFWREIWESGWIFLERYTRGIVLATKCGSDKYQGVKDWANVKCFPKILSVKYFT